MPEKLWTPDGPVQVERGVEELDRYELQTIARMHEIAQKFGIALVCMRCDQSFKGANTGHEADPGISCGCRELRYLGNVTRH